MNIFEKLIKRVKFGKTLNLDETDASSFILIANEYIEVLGGKENIEDLYSCSTRLRIKISENKIDEERLMKFGAKRIIKLDELNYQIIVGKKATILEETIKKYLG